MKIRSKILAFLFWLFVLAMFVISAALEGLVDWFNMRFEVSFEEILFTITSPMEGSDVGFLEEAVDYLLPYVYEVIPTVIVCVILVIFLRMVSLTATVKIYKLRIKIKAYTVYKLVWLAVAVVCLADVLSYGYESLDMGTYIERRMQKTTVYEEHYVDPDTVEISMGDEPKNLIYIYMESMEMTYASIEDGGAQEEINYIPNLTKMASENISFSDKEGLGGMFVSTGASWTMGALFTSSAGVPFSFPVQGNTMDRFESFAPGITALGDILDSFGYKQIFLCGSDGEFAGRQAFYEQHGNYEVRDYNYAIDKGYIPEDYRVWWGYEDKKLYDIAKKELLELAENDEPFNYTMLTVDTHHVDGYICEDCEDKYEEQLGNVLACADRQIYEFIQWCQEQEFYEDTVIVIVGDHYRMDLSLVKDLDRRLYNCIINSDTEVEGTTEERVVTTMDLFPTVLSAMGFDIEGDRLGLGTDAFSDTPTLAEELGWAYLAKELGKYSEYYVENFE